MAGFLRAVGRRKALAAVAGVGLLGLHQYDTHYCYERINRSARGVYAAAYTLWAYKARLVLFPEQLSQIHDDVAALWLRTCQTNGGLYVKLGQSIAVMSHILPVEYNERFQILYDQAPRATKAEVTKLFKEEFGKPPEEIFKEFDIEAVASASVAQVHRAVLKDGTPVAVKVQKPNIIVQTPWDLALYRMLVFAFDKLFDLPLYWTVDEICDNLTKEANFVREAENTRRAKADLKDVRNVYVPYVVDDLVTKRVLTMEWIDGIKLSDQAGVLNMGFRIKQVVTTMIEAFSHQIFVCGFVHGDPHPGNVMVRKNKNNPGEPEIVILDHGLCIEESEKFRLEYAQLWKAMVLSDTAGMAHICKSWGIRDPELFASIQLFQPYRKATPVVAPKRLSREEMIEYRKQTKERVRTLLSDTNKVPRELIIVGRSLNIIRSNNKQLGSLVNRVNVMAYKAAEGSSIRGQSAGRWEVFSFWLRLKLLTLTYNAIELWRKVNGLFGKEAPAFEEILEQNLQLSVEEKLGIQLHRALEPR